MGKSINGNQEFSDDPQKNLGIENEILRLKLRAQFGADCGVSTDCSPEMENHFLHEIMAFEEAWTNSKEITVYEFLGKPGFKNIAELEPSAIITELERLTKIMEEKEMFLHTEKEYEPITIFRFITEKLFIEKTDDVRIPGYTRNFIYEEFEPDEDRNEQES